MSKVPPSRGCKSDEDSTDGLEDGEGVEASNIPDGAGIGELPDSPDVAGVGKPSVSADGIPSECDGDDRTDLLRKEGRPLILSRRDSNLCFGIADEAIARSTRR